MKRLVMVGLGPVHLYALYAFARQRVASAQVVWIAPSDKAIIPGQEAACVAGDQTLAAATLDLLPVWRAADVTPLHVSVTALNLQQRRLALSDGQELSYDALSLDLASVIDRDQIAGARHLGLFTQPPEFFLDMVERLIELAQARDLNVVLVGEGAAAFEVSLALGARLRRTGSGASRLVWVTGGAPPLEGFSEVLRQRALELLKKQGVTVLQAACTAVEREYVTLDNGARVACDAPVMALPPKLPRWLTDSGLAMDEWGQVDGLPTLQSRSHPNVFTSRVGAGLSAVGSTDTPQLACQAGAALAENLRRFIGSGQLLPWTPGLQKWGALSCPGHRALMTVGHRVLDGRWAGWWQQRVRRESVRALTL